LNDIWIWWSNILKLLLFKKH